VAVKQNYARHNPLREVKRPSDMKAIRERIISLAEEKLYFAHAKNNLAKIARLILLQGLRPEEAMRIRKEDVDLEKGTLRFFMARQPRRAARLSSLRKRALFSPRRRARTDPGCSRREEPGRHIVRLNCTHDHRARSHQPCRVLRRAGKLHRRRSARSFSPGPSV